MRILLTVLWLALVAKAAERPNVVLVITDDQGYGDLSCHGNPVLKTPHLDTLHAESLRLTDYHVAPTCSPTRASLLTGQWSNRTGVWHTIAGRSLLDKDKVTIASLLQKEGYRTAMIGKWHLGDNAPFRPQDHGFDEVFYHGGGGMGQTPDAWDNGYFDARYFDAEGCVKEPGFCTDVFFGRARDFIDESASEEEPFFLYLSTNAPHSPMHAPEVDAAPYIEAGLDTRTAHFFGMIANIDANVGRLRRHLAAKGLAENTVFIFTTDNGTSAGGGVFNAGMRGTKGSAYEGGHRVPFFVHWPARGLDKGRDDDGLCGAVDVLPTLLEIAQVRGVGDLKVDGRVLDAFCRTKDRPRPRFLITDSQRVNVPVKWKDSCVMFEKWRLVNGEELYDVGKDPGQKRDISKENGEMVEKLRAAYEKWWAELEPGFKKRARIAVNRELGDIELTCHDWIDGDETAWHQGMIRAGSVREANGGTWALEVETAGKYEVEVRRWPRGVKAGAAEGLIKGSEQPGQLAFRTVEGEALPISGASVEIANQNYQLTATNSGFYRAVLPFPSGSLNVRVSYILDDNSEIGAYYVTLRPTE